MSGTRVWRRQSYDDAVPERPKTMKTRLHIRQVAWAMGFVTAFGWTSAHADIYTWVDSSGKVNLSNRAPPEGARVTNVFREDPAAQASAEAARAATQSEELRALRERVTQLERDIETAKQPAPAPAPVVYVPAMPAPAPYPSVMAQAIVAPTTQPTYGPCGDPWGNCFSPGSFGFYPGGVVVVNEPAFHRFRPAHRVPARPSAHDFPAPAGSLHAPLNLFGDGRPLNLFGPSQKAQGISR